MYIYASTQNPHYTSPNPLPQNFSLYLPHTLHPGCSLSTTGESCTGEQPCIRRPGEPWAGAMCAATTSSTPCGNMAFMGIKLFYLHRH